MKKLIVFSLFALLLTNIQAQDIYDPSIDGMEQIKEAVAKANKENKHVIVQTGGMWCKYCIQLHDWIDNTLMVKNDIDKYYVYINLSVSNENRNDEAMEFLRYPQRFGYPTLLVLNKQGDLIHTQEIYPFDSNGSYDEELFRKFLSNWNVMAVDPKKYQ